MKKRSNAVLVFMLEGSDMRLNTSLKPQRMKSVVNKRVCDKLCLSRFAWVLH